MSTSVSKHLFRPLKLAIISIFHPVPLQQPKQSASLILPPDNWSLKKASKRPSQAGRPESSAHLPKCLPVPWQLPQALLLIPQTVPEKRPAKFLVRIVPANRKVIQEPLKIDASTKSFKQSPFTSPST